MSNSWRTNFNTHLSSCMLTISVHHFLEWCAMEAALHFLLKAADEPMIWTVNNASCKWQNSGEKYEMIYCLVRKVHTNLLCWCLHQCTQQVTLHSVLRMPTSHICPAANLDCLRSKKLCKTRPENFRIFTCQSKPIIQLDPTEPQKSLCTIKLF